MMTPVLFYGERESARDFRVYGNISYSIISTSMFAWEKYIHFSVKTEPEKPSLQTAFQGFTVLQRDRYM